MNDFFLSIVNFSITATYIAAAVMLLRLIFKKAPKWISGVLWGLVGMRLLFPFSIESIFSLIPNNKPIPDNITTMPKPEIDSGIPIINDTFNPIISDTFAPSPEVSINPMETVITVASYVWLIGIAAMLIYMAVSYLRVRLKVMESIRTEGNVYKCDNLKTAFILGVIRPKIYVPSDMNKADLEFVAAHERAHIKRLDHVWKPLGFLLLAVYWFNPVLWVAYVLLCRDIELACDEKVLKEMGIESKTRYSTALVNCSVRNKAITACPLAFGEVGIKERVMRILNYKKPAFWVIVLSLVAVAVVAVCFLTDPIRNDPSVEGTPSIQLPDKAFELEDDLINALNFSFFARYNIYHVDNSIGTRIENMKYNTDGVLYAAFSPSDYYFACCYRNSDVVNDYKKFFWVGFNSPQDIVQTYEGGNIVQVAQINKSVSCINILSEDTINYKVEHITKYDPVWSNSLNTAPQIVFEEEFIFSSKIAKSKNNIIYLCSTKKYFYEQYAYPSITFNGQSYLTQPIYSTNQSGHRYDYNLDAEFTQYYADFMDVIIMDEYNVTNDYGVSTYYGLIKIEDFAEIIKKHIES